MARLAPFRGIRYDTALAPLVDVTAPPYDVIDDAGRARLAARHRHNVVHVDLPLPDDDLDRYAAADRRFRGWVADGVLTVDPEPVLYGYRMAFTDPAGRARRTTGVFGALALARPDEGVLLPHEHTTPKAKSDRLDLLRSTEANLSAIWGLSPVPGLTAAIGEPDDRAERWTDDDGIEHTLWVIDDAARIGAVVDRVAAAPVLIADGHHRYETSLVHRDERRDALGEGGPADAVLALVVELVDDELTVLPIHRVLTNVPAGADLVELLAPWFEPGPEVPIGPDTLDRLVDAGALGIVRGDATTVVLVHPRPGAFGSSPDLDSSRLDVALAALGGIEVRYQHGIDEVATLVSSGEAEVGVLLRPATVAQIEATAHGGERMPPKTTYFHPKPRTGAVLRDLRS